MVVYRPAEWDLVYVQHDVPYHTSGGETLTLDLYYPPGDLGPRHRIPAVVVVAGYPDRGFAAKVGCKFKELGSSISWGRLIASAGLMAVTYTNREPTADLDCLLRYLQRNATTLGVDEGRLGLWASSGNVPLALSLLRQPALPQIKCAVLCYGLLLDLEGARHTADLAAQFGFANPGADMSISDLARDIPFYLARAGQDQFPHLNETLDRFLRQAVAQNLPVTFVNHPAAPHAFDLYDESEATRKIIRQILSFLRRQLRG